MAAGKKDSQANTSGAVSKDWEASSENYPVLCRLHHLLLSEWLYCCCASPSPSRVGLGSAHSSYVDLLVLSLLFWIYCGLVQIQSLL